MPTSPSGSNNPAFVSAVRGTVRSRRLIDPGDPVLVAASGGPDSAALLHVLRRIARQMPMSLAVAHFHHGLRGAEADRDAAFVARQAADMGLPFYAGRGDVKGLRRRERLSAEEAARRLRYEFLHQIADRHGFARIALGHHADDSAESVLMFLFRGSGRRGISGIRPKRGMLIRPLIDRRRKEILAYLEACGVPFVVDASNADPAYMRNRIRNELIPLLTARYNPNLIETLGRLSAVASAEEHWMETLTAPLLASALRRQAPQRLELSTAELTALPVAARRRVLRRAIASVHGDLRAIGFRQTEAVVGLLEADGGFAQVHLPGGMAAFRQYGRLTVCRRQDVRSAAAEAAAAPHAPFCYRLSGPGEVRLPEAGLRLRLSVCGPVSSARLRRSGQQTAFFDMEKICFPITVRNARPGDRFRPLGLGGTQKLQDFFVNRKVPRALRQSCPVLISSGKIVWVAGHRIAEDVKVGSRCRAVLFAELLADSR